MSVFSITQVKQNFKRTSHTTHFLRYKITFIVSKMSHLRMYNMRQFRDL